MVSILWVFSFCIGLIRLKTINITLVRHGEPEQLGLLLGHTDLNLSKLGEQQLINRFNNLKFERLISSPLKRCLVMAEYIATKRKMTVDVEVNIKEMNFGDWDGLGYDSLWQQTPSLGDFWQNPIDITPPNGESFLAFQTRVNKWWQSLIHQASGDTVVLTHAGVIKQVISNLLNEMHYAELSNKIKIDYAGVINIEVKQDDQGNVWPLLKF